MKDSILKLHKVVVAFAALAVLATGCGGRDGAEEIDSGSGQSDSVATANFGDLSEVCGPGDASTASAQGVTADSIEVGVFSDIGFTKNSEFVDTAKVFTSWCNEAGGINGRELVANTRDSKLMEPRQRMIEACRDDFALVGGGAALDGLGVETRLECLLPSFPAQAVQEKSAGADLEVSASPSKIPGYDNYAGIRTWLMDEAYPESKGAIGMLNGDAAVSKLIGDINRETLVDLGATIVYDELFPLSGVTDWTPYAQAIKSSGVRGLVFLGTFDSLSKLEESLTNMDYKLDWIDANNNAYNDQFIQLLGRSADFQNNVVDLSGVAPLESDEPAVEELKALFDKYAPVHRSTLPAMRAWSSWLLFAKAATACGDDLTRTCVYETAREETAWTGGGLHVANDLAEPLPPQPCFNVEHATSEGWEPADFGADNGLYRCDIPARELSDGTSSAPLTLADVGKSMNDLE